MTGADQTRAWAGTKGGPPLVLVADRVFSHGRLTGPAAVRIVDGQIDSLAPPSAAASVADGTRVERLPAGALLAPGFIDTQVNGGGDVLLNDQPNIAGLTAIADAHQAFGVTGLMPTLITDSEDAFEKLAATAAAVTSTGVPAGVVGVHLEGPWLSPARRGVHRADLMRAPTPSDLDRVLACQAFGRVLVTLAPEIVGADTIRALVEDGVIVAAGHTDADAATLLRAIDAGLSGVTHLYNAMRFMTSREPGVLGTALADTRLIAGIIADGITVAPQLLRVAFRAMGAERLMLVTDTMPTVGGRSTTFKLVGRSIRLIEGRLEAEDGTLAGAHLDMATAVRNAMQLMGANLTDALTMATATPARFLRLYPQKGFLAPGSDADLVALGPDMSATATWRCGLRSLG